MIIQNKGETFIANGKVFTIGGMVLANAEDEYAGLTGRIMEIRTGTDKETGNGGPDIYCDFDVPEKESAIVELEERFSELYDEPKTIEEIPLGDVIMSPDMLEPIAESVQSTDKTLYALSYKKENHVCGFSGTLGVSSDRSLLMRRMLDVVKELDSAVVLMDSEENGSGAHYTFDPPEWESNKTYLEFDLFTVPFYPALKGGATA